MSLAMNLKFYVYSHNIYIYVPIFFGQHFVLYLVTIFC